MLKRKVVLQDILILALALLLLAAMLFACQRQFQAMQEAWVRVDEEQLALAQAEARLQTLQAVQKEAPRYREQLALLDRRIPPEPAENILVSHLQALSLESAQVLEQLRFESRHSNDGYTEMPMQIRLKGSYHGLLMLLERARTGDRALRIDQIRLSGPEFPAELNIELTVFAFHRQE